MGNKRMTRKMAEDLIKQRYDDWEGEPIGPLCSFMDHRLYLDWRKAWNEMNTREHPVILYYFRHDFSETESSFLRLLTLHLWIRHEFK
jgi:hypothetical protein